MTLFVGSSETKHSTRADSVSYFGDNSVANKPEGNFQ